MSSLHTRYRPKLFKQVLGQEAVVRSLASQIKKREAHSYLFVGPSGTGKTTLARICASKLGAAGPDIMEIDAATFNGVDEMRGITRNAQYHSIGAGAKVHIIDECFAQGTLVLTPNGETPIESLHPGLWIIGAKGPAQVRHVMRRSVPSSRVLCVRLSTGRMIECSCEHPFLTFRGWVSADQLVEGEELVDVSSKVPDHLQKMWDHLFVERTWSSTLCGLPATEVCSLRKNVSRFAWFPQHDLFDYLWQHSRRPEEAWIPPGLLASGSESGFGDGAPRETKVFSAVGSSTIRSYEEKEPELGCQYPSKGSGYQREEGDTSYLERHTGRQWADYEAASAVGSNIEMFSGISDKDWVCQSGQSVRFWLPSTLQSRFSVSQDTIGYRGGWLRTQLEGIEKPRQQENRQVSRTWVVSVEGLERRGRSERSLSGAENSGSRANSRIFYDLEIEGHPSYIVEGTVVHNCHQLSKQAWSSLLKSIEEPPDHVFWFFCTTDGNKVPKTIQTRCVAYTLKPVPDESILELLGRVCAAEDIQVESEILSTIVDEAMGSPRQALVYLAACSTAESLSEARQLMEKVGEEAEVISLCRYLMDRGKPKDWPGIARRLEKIKDQSGEGIRQVLIAYMTKAALSATSAKTAMLPLRLLDAFERPCNTSDKIEPIMLGLAKVFIMGRPQ